jgi:GNAT superfamily N-acetyltransferase
MWEDMGVNDSALLEAGDRAYKKWVKSEIAHGRIVGWIVENRDGVVAGGGGIWLRPAQPRPQAKWLIDPYLLSMFTEPQFRRMGVGSRIVEEAIAWCRKQGHNRILLHASKKGRGLYRKYGFTRTWEMRLELDDARRGR